LGACNTNGHYKKNPLVAAGGSAYGGGRWWVRWWWPLMVAAYGGRLLVRWWCPLVGHLLVSMSIRHESAKKTQLSDKTKGDTIQTVSFDSQSLRLYEEPASGYS